MVEPYVHALIISQTNRSLWQTHLTKTKITPKEILVRTGKNKNCIWKCRAI